MTRTPTADIPTADLVARTLQAVADAVPVADRPPADTTDQHGLTPISTTDQHGMTRAGANRDGDGGGVDRHGMAPTGTTDRRGVVGGGATAPAGAGADGVDRYGLLRSRNPVTGEATVVRLAPAIPTAATSGPHRWRRGRRSAAAVLGAAAALVVAVVAVRAGIDGNDARPATDLSDPASVQFVPEWLPDDVTIEVGLVGRVADSGLAIDAALLGSPDGTGDVLVAALERSDGRPIGEQQVRKVRNAIDTPSARLEDDGAEGRDGSRGWVAVSRGSASRDDALAAGAALMDDAAPIDRADPADWADVLPGWTPRPVPLGWLPNLAPTYRTRYAGDERSVDVLAVVGDLPQADLLPTLLVDARTVTIRGQQGWISSLPSAGSDMLVWQEAPGLVGAVIADGLSSDELVQVADGLRVAEQPAGDAAVEAVAEGDVEGMAYRIERRVTGSEGRCVTLYVDGVRHGPLCGLEDPDGPFAQIGPVDRNDDVTLVWGVLGAHVREIAAAPPANVSAPALPLDPDDPASLRYVLLALPTQSSPVDITLSDAEGHALAVTTVDPQGTIGG